MGYLDNNGLQTLWSKIKSLKLANPNKLTFTGASTGSYDGSSALTVNIPSGSGGAAWGDITGTLSNQTDLQEELDNKQDAHSPHVLWSGGSYMNGSQTINLSENISAQPHGVVLHFQAYSSGVQNYRHQYYFIPRTHVASYNGSGLLVPLGQELSSSDGSMLMTGKYLYVYDGKITGYANNGKSKSAAYVLTQVIGV